MTPTPLPDDTRPFWQALLLALLPEVATETIRQVGEYLRDRAKAAQRAPGPAGGPRLAADDDAPTP